MTSPIRVNVDQRNPFGFMLVVFKSGSPCPICTSCEVACVTAAAGTPETCRLAMERVEALGFSLNDKGKTATNAFVSASFEIMPVRTICGPCGHATERNWNYIEDPAITQDGVIRREDPTPFKWEGWDLSDKLDARGAP